MTQTSTVSTPLLLKTQTQRRTSPGLMRSSASPMKTKNTTIPAVTFVSKTISLFSFGLLLSGEIEILTGPYFTNVTYFKLFDNYIGYLFFVLLYLFKDLSENLDMRLMLCQVFVLIVSGVA